MPRRKRKNKSSLARYYAKRHFGKTPEPRGRPAAREGRSFVIQKHGARRLHYDFRLEWGGTLKSWAVPKGPSLDPADKRLAVRVEDHPLEYGGFEGVIPEGEYGAGPVIVWDRGTYENLTEQDGAPKPVAKALEDGHLLIALHGQKLAGGYALQRLGAVGDPKWLLVKIRDQAADARRRPTSSEPRSVASGRTVAELAKTAAVGDGDG